MMKTQQLLGSFGALGVMLCLAPASQATIIGFANTAGSNAKVPAALGSNATVDAGGVTVSNGATPNIAVEFVNPTWDYHHSGNFDVIEAHTAAGAFDSDGDPDIAQVETSGASIIFTPDAGFALVLNAFDFGLSRETLGQGNDWTISLTDEADNVVWTTDISLLNQGAGDTRTLAPGFTGQLGEAYTLTFDLTAEVGGNFGTGRNALDNLSFNQTAVPEPGSLALLGLGGLLVARRRRSI